MKESPDKILTNLTKTLWIILGVVFIALGLLTFFPMLFKAAYTNNVYDLREVERITDLQFGEKPSKISGVSCTNLTYKSKTDSEYTDLSYLLFPNIRSAKKALKKLATGNHFYENSVIVTDYSVEGYRYGVCDADIYEYYYRSGNLVIKAEAVYGNFGTKEEIDAMAVQAKKDNERIANLKEWLPTVFKTDK